MATERLDVVISVLDRYSQELDQLLIKLAEVDAAAEAVEDITIDVDVRGERKLDLLMAKLAALGALDLDDVNVDVRSGAIAAGGGGALAGAGPGGGRGGGGMALQRATRQTAQAVAEMDDAVDLTNVRMSDLHNLLAALVPLLLVFIGAIPALLGALVALAAAAIAAAAGLAALAGFGLLGAAAIRGDGDLAAGFEEILEEVQSDFLDAFQPLGDRLAGFFEDALDGLDRLFERIASRGDVLVAFTDTARDFGEFMLDFLPELLADLGKMARAFGPFFGRLMDEFDFSVLEALTNFMARAADETILFTALLIDFIAVIGRMSIGFLQVVNAIGAAVQAFAVMLRVLPLSEEAWGAFIATLLTAMTVMFLWNKLASLQIIATLATTMPAAITSSVAALDAFIVHQLVAAGASVVLAEAISLVVIAATAGLAVITLAAGVGMLADSFNLLEQDVGAATDALREFNRLGDDLGPNPFAEPRLGTGSVTGSSGVNQVNIRVEGNADEDMVREQAGNAMYRMERRRRGF